MWWYCWRKKHRFTLICNQRRGTNQVSVSATHSAADGAHWSAPDRVFGEATAVGVSEAKLDHEYNYKT